RHEPYRRALAGHHLTLAELEVRAGQPAEAVACLQERQALCAGRPGELYRGAVELARAAALVGKGKDRLSGEEEAQRRQYADLVMAALRQAAAAGFRDAGKLQGESAFSVVRGREDFAELLADLQEGETPKDMSHG